MMKWIRLFENDESEYYVNINNISWLSLDTRTICVNGVSGIENGLLHLSEESHIDLILEIEGLMNNENC